MFNPERGKQLFEIQKSVNKELGIKRRKEMERKVNMVINAKQPQAEIFKTRRNMKKVTNIDFPLKDNKGNIQVTKIGINKVITTHYNKVFAQNPIPHDKIWRKYWKIINQIFEILNNDTQMNNYEYEEPTLDEIQK